MSRLGLPPGKPKLRKREIALAVGAGLLASVGAAAVLEGMHEERAPTVASAPAEAIGSEADRVYEVPAFDNIASIGPQNIVVTYGKAFSVRSEGPAGALSRLEVVSSNGTLTIKPQGSFGFNVGRLRDATFYVTLPQLSSVVLTGSGDMTVDKVEGAKFSGMVAGSGALQIDAMQVDEASLNIGGSGKIAAKGVARSTNINIGGAGEVDAGDLKSDDASITVAGSGDVGLFVANQANISIMGSGDVEIDGTDKCTVSRMGSGDVICNGKDIEDRSDR
ncbi:DUF2807 domain-containing protein [Altererythrobacter salegens]|uniref:DUF2807 domain-containing protein n=1 Tax=Croceibacterium salegens TaxID=1737568 RepID=A0A6I4T026_9SPHN|nr:head GIN domain-containing protein [Croceibacterium salegens]MXO60516.1 DUF2807 domain-containing protein [Croceibacterium salegens]